MAWSLTTLLVAALAAAPANPTVLHALEPDVAKAAGLEAKGYKLVDVTDAYLRLDQDSLSSTVMPDDPPPPWATGALKKDWETGTAGCRYRIGPPPYAGKGKAVFCGQDVANAVWQRHLERLASNGVVVYGVVIEEVKAPGFSVEVGGYRVDEAARRALSATAKTRAEGLEVAAELVGKILAGEGKVFDRKILRQLPEAPAGADTEMPVALHEPVPAPPGCAAKLPRKLTLGTDRASATLAKLWSASVPNGGAPERACSLVYKQTEGSLGGTSIFVADASLDCGGQTFSSKKRGMVVSSVEGQALQDLVKQAFDAWCK